MNEDKLRDLDRATVRARAEREVFKEHVSALAAQVVRDAAGRGELPVSPDDVHWGAPPGLVRVTGDWYRIDSLDAAWSEAEALRPEGWVFHGVSLTDHSADEAYVDAETRSTWGPDWTAGMSWPGHCKYDDCDHDEAFVIATGDTPAAALRALTARLRENGVSGHSAARSAVNPDAPEAR